MMGNKLEKRGQLFFFVGGGGYKRKSFQNFSIKTLYFPFAMLYESILCR